MSKKTLMAKAIIAGLLVAGLGGAAIAQDAAANIAARQAFMKGLTAQNRAAQGGDAAAKAAIEAGFKAFKTQFPAGSDSSVAPTRALPAIWANKADFDAKVDAAAAAAAAGGPINCASCHTAYRGPAA